MSRFGFVSGTYQSQSPVAAADLCMNWYPEQVESGTGNAPIVLYPTPGLEQFADLTPVVPPVEFAVIQAKPGNIQIGIVPNAPFTVSSTGILAVGFTDISGASMVTFTDSDGNIWTLVDSDIQDGAFNVFLFVCDSLLAGSPTIQSTPSGTFFTNALSIVVECSGLITGPLDKLALGRGTNETTLDSGNTSATTQASEAIFGFGWTHRTEATTPITPDPAWTDLNGIGEGNTIIRGQYKTVSMIGAQDAQMTTNGSEDLWAMLCATFKVGP